MRDLFGLPGYRMCEVLGLLGRLVEAGPFLCSRMVESTGHFLKSGKIK